MSKLRVAMISPWKVRCGLYTYSKNLTEGLAGHGVETYIVRLPRFGVITGDMLQNVVDAIPLSKVDLIHCYPSGTPVLTADGVKHIEDISIDDVVWTHMGRQRTVTETFSRKYNGKLIKLNAQYNKPLLVTPEHPFLIVKNINGGKDGHIERFFQKNKGIRPDWVAAQDIEVGDFVVLPRVTKIEHTHYFSCVEDFVCPKKNYRVTDTHVYVSSPYGIRRVPLNIVVTEDFCRLAGYYVAEGSINGNQIRFSFGKNAQEQKYIDDVLKIMLNRFDLKGSVYIAGNSTTLTFSNRYVAHMFASTFGKGARNKKIPNWLFFEPYNYQHQFIKGYWRGDGTVERDGFSITCYSETLREQFRILVARLGIVCAVYKDTMKIRGKSLKLFEKILGVKHPWTSKWNHRDFAHIDDEYIYYKIRSKEDVVYTDDTYVHNLEVFQDNSYVVQGYTSHNCQHEYGRYHGFEDWFFNSLKALNKPIVTTMHTTGYRTHIDRVIANVSKKLIVHNKYMAEKLGRACTVIAHGCLPPQPHVERELAKRLTAVPPIAPVVGYCGFISEVKGIEILIEAMIQVPDAALVIAGGWFVEAETSYIKNIKDWSLKELKGRCLWLGYVSDSRLATTYSAMDIVVYPSKVTSESGALLMALSHGKPVLASDIAAFRDKRPAFDTFKDVNDLVKKLKLWLTDRKYTKKYEANAKKYVEEHSWPKIASLHLQVYEKALKKGGD